MSSPVIVNSVWNLQKSCPIDHLFDIRTNIPIRDCIDYIRPISWAPAKRAITAKSHRFILWGAITCAASLTNAAPKMEYPDPDHTLLPSGQLLTPLATPGAQQQHPYGKVPVRTAGLAITSDGRKLVVTNVYNDSVSVVNLATHQPEERDLRPGKNDPSKHGVSGREYPFGVRSCKALDWLTKSSLRRAENILAQNFLKSAARCLILSKIPCLNVSLTG